eukprot:TRINITY_DN73235_c0_g1_i1.p1 TRINITY_DN73235_c0_g1~~TRINITY_DN73235_c0_g1_i1.p1  ORF type:complete len:540 (-),score=81.72 TRINITY_DN73235_c0_g1_i1:89-1708(-)
MSCQLMTRGAVQAHSFQSTPMQQHRQVKQQSMQTLSAAATQVFANSPSRQEPVAFATGPCATSRGTHSHPHRTQVRSPQPQQLQQRARAVATSSGVLTPHVGGFKTPCSVVLPARRQSGMHSAHHIRGRSLDPLQARTPLMQIYATVIRSRSGTPTPRREYSQPYIFQKHGTVIHSHLPTPLRSRTGVAPIAPAMQTLSNSQATIHTKSALAVSTKDKSGSVAPSLCSTMNRIPQASTQATGRSVQSSGVFAPEQLQQVAAKLQAHQLAQTQTQTSSVTAPVGSSTVEQAQDLVCTIQLSAEALQERAFPRPSLEDKDAERLLHQQSYEDTLRDLKHSRLEKQDLQAQLDRVQADKAPETHTRERAEQDIKAKASECEKRVQAGRKLESENSALSTAKAQLLEEFNAKCEELQNRLKQVQSSHEDLNAQNELLECLQNQFKELSKEQALVANKVSSESQRRLQEEQEAKHNFRKEREMHRLQIEQLMRFVAERERPAVFSAPPPITVQENERLETRYAEMLAELDNALRHLRSTTLCAA